MPSSLSCKRILAAILALIALSHLLFVPAAAFENDVHFGLTKWLALQAGLTEANADKVARGNLDRDEANSSAVHVVIWHICLAVLEESKRVASQRVSDDHFPSKTRVGKGTVPTQRAVEPGSADASRVIDPLVPGPQGKVLPAKDNTLADLGAALHPFQDSWSHQGIPDVPAIPYRFGLSRRMIRCDENFAWSHPRSRGGFQSHDADITYLWRNDGTGTAQMTYEKLKAFATANKWATRGKARDSPQLQPDIASFVEAKTKTEKAKWFTDRGFASRPVDEFLAGISIPDGTRPFGINILINRLISLSAPRPHTVLAQTTPPLPVEPFLNNFFKAWFTTTNVDALMNLHIDSAEVARNAGFTSGDPASIAKTLILMWRIADHGLVTELGHALPAKGDHALQQLKQLTEKPGALYRFELPPLVPLGRDRAPYIVIPIQDNHFLVLARFAHAPRDGVALVVAPRPSAEGFPFRIVTVTWAIDDQHASTVPARGKGAPCC